jgi:hypothetical protein
MDLLEPRSAPENLLSAQARHPLPVCLRELRPGRPADAQWLLTRLADLVEAEGVEAALSLLPEVPPSSSLAGN